MSKNSVSQYLRKAYQDFTGGLATRADALHIPANKFSQLENAILNDHDILEKVQGYTVDGSPFTNVVGSFIRMLINYKVGTTVNTLVCAASDAVANSNSTYNVDLKQTYGDGTYAYIGHTIGTALFTMTSAVVTGTTTQWASHLKAGDKIGTGAAPTIWYEIQSVDSATQVTLTAPYAEATTSSVSYMARIILNKNNIPNGLVFNSKLLICNGVDAVLSTNNTSLGKLQSANWQTVQLLEAHKNRVFGANWPAKTSGLLWTAANDETIVDAAAEASVFAQDNGQIVAIKSFANSLMVFKDNGKIYQVIGEFDQSAVGQPALIRLIDVPDNLGVISGKTVVVCEDNNRDNIGRPMGSKIFFLSETGIYTVNSYMQVNKVSWDIAPTVQNILIKSTATATKAYSFTSKSEWDSGTISGLSDTRVSNGISTYFDSLNLATAKQTNGGVSTFLDSTNNVHTAYIGADGKTVRYNHWLASDNTNVDSQVCDVTTTATIKAVSSHFQTVSAVSIAVAPNGTVGIAWKTYIKDLNADVDGSGHGSGTYYYFFSELIAGAWVHTKIANGNQTDENPQGHGVKALSYRPDAVGLALKYNAANAPHVIATQGSSSTVSGGVTFFQGLGCSYFTRPSSTWVIKLVADQQSCIAANLFIDSSSNIHVILATATTGVRYYTSSDSGATFTNPKNIVVSGTSPRLGTGYVAIAVDDALDPILIYNFTGGTASTGDVGRTVRYNVTDSSTTYPASTANYLKGYANSGGTKEFYYTIQDGLEKFIYDTNYAVGTAQFVNGTKAVVGTGTKWTTWVAHGDLIRLSGDDDQDYGTVDTVNSDNSITLLANYAGSSATAAYVSKRTTTVAATDAVMSNSWYVGAQGLHNNGNVVASVSYGLSVNEIRLRRVTLYGKWTSPIESDSTLSRWNTFVIGTPISNGNTLTYEVGLSTTATILVANTDPIVSGTVISTNASNIYAQAIITFNFLAFAQSSVSSLAMNYVGTGADAKIPVAYVFNNELYMSVTPPSAAGNTEIVFLDRAGAWGLFTVGTCAMAKYNQQLYIGSATNGDVYKFRYGYDFGGGAYSLIATTKEDLLGSIELQKEIYKVYVIYKTQLNGDFTFSYRLDNFLAPNTAAWVDETIDHTQGSIREISSMAGKRVSSIQFKVSQADADVQVGIVGFIVLYDFLDLR